MHVIGIPVKARVRLLLLQEALILCATEGSGYTCALTWCALLLCWSHPSCWSLRHTILGTLISSACNNITSQHHHCFNLITFLPPPPPPPRLNAHIFISACHHLDYACNMYVIIMHKISYRVPSLNDVSSWGSC